MADVELAEIDPVCGMKVLPEKAAASVHHAGRTWYFCAQGCRTKFEAEPGQIRRLASRSLDIHRHCLPRPRRLRNTPAPCILKCSLQSRGPARNAEWLWSQSSPSSAVEHIEYTCPMHPQIVRDRPGTCPICGMALEPRTVTADAANPELVSMTRRLWVGAVLTLPLLAVMVSDVLPGHPLQHLLTGRLVGVDGISLATPVVLWGGWPFFERGWASIVHRSLNMFTLIAIGSGAAYLYSVAAVVAPGLFPATFRDASGNLGLYFEAAAVITVLVLLGQVLELRARSQTSGAIQALLGLAPKTARRISADGSEADVAVSEVAVGDLLRIRPGEKVPVDGVVHRWAQLGRRIDGHRRAHPGRKDGGRQSGGRNDQRNRQPGDESRARWGRHPAGADRENGERGAKDPRPHSTPCRSGGFLLRPGGAGCGRDHLCGLGRLWPISRGTRMPW